MLQERKRPFQAAPNSDSKRQKRPCMHCSSNQQAFAGMQQGLHRSGNTPTHRRWPSIWTMVMMAEQGEGFIC